MADKVDQQYQDDKNSFVCIRLKMLTVNASLLWTANNDIDGACRVLQ